MKFQFDNTAKVKEEAKRYRLPPCPPGREKYLYDIGDAVCHSGEGRYKRGVPACIAERWIENGYCYYQEAKGLVNRQRDLMRVESEVNCE